MPIKVCWSETGPFAFCDTPAEAAELLRLRSASSDKPESKDQSRKAPELVNLSEDEAMDRFISELKPNQRNFLSALAHHPTGINGTDIAEEINCEGRQLGAMIGAISKNAKRNGVKLKQILLSEMRFEGPRRFRFFQPKALLLRHGNKIIAQRDLKLSA